MTPIPNLPEQLSRAIYADLLTLLPPPAEDTPEARATRDQRAVTALAHLLPENAAEAELAVQIVAAQFHAKDALREAARASADPAEVRRCRTQATSMMRQADSGMRTLSRMQAERVKAETALRPAAMERAGYWFRDCSVPSAEPAQASPPADEVEPTLGQARVDEEVRMYVTLYPARAAQIVAAGGFTDDMKFGPPDPHIVAGLLRGTAKSQAA
jgi:hypothetical protein